MKKYIITIALVITTLLFHSCAKNFGEINIDPTQFTEATPEAALQGAFKRLNDFMGNANYTTYWDMANIINSGSRYGTEERGIWQNMYVFVLEPVNQVKLTYGNQPDFNNRVQIARIWEAYTYSILVATFGPIPCSEANNREHLASIKFDDEDSVYAYVLNTLKEAATQIDVSKTQDRLVYDAIYGPSAISLTNWKKFANTLRLKIALRCANNLPQLSEQHIREVMNDEANTISTESETTKMLYENVINNENPHYIRFKRNSYTLDPPSMNDYLFVHFRSYKDPRLDAYFDSVPLSNLADRYLLRDTLPSRNDDSLRVVDYRIPHFGRIKSPAKLPGWTALNGIIDPFGQNVRVATYSRIKGYGWPTLQASGEGITAPDRPFIILSYAEAQLLKAEAAAKGMGGSKTAEQYYNEGIDANFAFWKISNTLRDAYKERDGIKWGTAGIGFTDYVSIVRADIPADPLIKIYTQQWLNYFPDQAFDVWCLQRRTRALDFSPHTNPGVAIATPWLEIPMRASYPTSVINLNPAGYQQGLLKLGGLQNDINPLIPLRFAKQHTTKDWNAVPVAYSTRYMQKWYGDYVEDLPAAGIAYTLISTFKP